MTDVPPTEQQQALIADRQAKLIWDTLTDLQQQYVIARLGVKTDTAACKLIGISCQVASNWPEKPIINEYVRYMRRNARDAAMKILTESMIEAANVLRRALRTRARITAAKDILDRGGLPAVTRQEITGNDGGPIEVRAVDYRNGIAEVAPRSISDSDKSGQE